MGKSIVKPVEANLGEEGFAEIRAELVPLRHHLPVIGVISGVIVVSAACRSPPDCVGIHQDLANFITHPVRS